MNVGSIDHRHASDLSAVELHDLLKLRVDVFVVEQECAYPELDGRDMDAETVHMWTRDESGVSGCLRLLKDPVGLRIGRVAARKDARGTGVATALMKQALRLAGSQTTVLDAQSHLSDWYARFGYLASGPEFLEDGIPHIPMTRPGDHQ